MKYILILCLCACFAACANKTESKMTNSSSAQNNSKKEVTQELKRYEFEIIRSFHHDPMAYTQGLFVHDGFLYESTGQRGESSLRKVDKETGKVLQKKELDAKYFGEGISLLNNEIFMLTWTEGKCFVFDLHSFNLKREYSYPGEGWGLTLAKDNSLIMTDGSNYLRYVNPADFSVKNTSAVYYLGSPVNALNEIERVGDLLFANIYTSDVIAVIDLNSHEMKGIIDCSELRKTLKDNPDAEAFNGVAFDETTKTFYITGKYWNTMFEIKVEDLF